MIPAHTKIIFSILLTGFSLAFTSQIQNVHATTKTFKSVQDASVRSKETSNNVNGIALEVAYDDAIFGLSKDIRRSYVKFDLSSIPDNATVNSAKLRLYQKSHMLTDNSITVDIVRLIGDWNETGVTWSNKPGNYAPTVSKSVSEGATWVEWTITNTVKGWVDGTYPNKGLEISGKEQASDYLLTFSSREGDKDPELVVNYDVPFNFDVIIPPIDFDDTTKPVISDVKVENITDTSAKITWTTDEDSDGYVDYDTDSSYDKTANGELDTKDHELNLYDLEPDTQYHYRVRAKDSSGNEAQTSDKTFTTEKQDELAGAPPVETDETATVENTGESDTTQAPSGTTQTTSQGTGSASDSDSEESMDPAGADESSDTQAPYDGKYVKVEDLLGAAKVAGLGLGGAGLLLLGVLLGKKFGSKSSHVRPTETSINPHHTPNNHHKEERENERYENQDENG